MNKLCSALGLLLVVALVIVRMAVNGAAAQPTEQPRADKALHEALSQPGAIDSSYESFVQPILTMLLRGTEIEEPLALNRPPQPGTLNVLVVDAKELAAVRTDDPAVKRLLPSIANNVLAIPPKTIVFDKAVITALTLNANERLAHRPCADENSAGLVLISTSRLPFPC